ncbi:ATP-binding protein [Myroides sp. WP-1]|uniref:hybrid sensor histidine kinase/response regulator n=1 Tax=Myroides sp. WP-1 TaxID=2759944 RepID=UPI0015FC691C|nr:ATP-binding protein [Myroides sp. WP-1]MBB1138879.1 response regulator [Myroides sp. WP-1]
MKPSKSIKLKIIFLYIILLGAVFFSGFYIYKEAKKFTLPEEQVVKENNKIFLVSSTLNNLYSSEIYSRNAIVTGNSKDIKSYYSHLDTLVNQIEQIKLTTTDRAIHQKIDLVQDLLKKKKVSFNNIIKARKEINEDRNYSEAIDKIYDIRDEIEKKIEPIVIQTKEKEKRSAWARLFKGDHTDTITKTINYPRVTDSIISAMENIILQAQQKVNQQQANLLKEEQKLIIENKNITNELRKILESIEHNLLTLSYQNINESKARISTASTNIAYIGGSALFVIIILGWIIIKDINQTQEYRLKLEQLNQEREVLLRSKTMLFATVTHDLQTPLGSLIGFANLLENTELKPKQRQYLNNIQSSTQYIANLINDLTDFSRLENNKISIQEKAFNPKELIESICAPLVPNAENKKIKLKWTVSPDLNNTFISDPYRLKQIVTNLITNALKFTQQGGVFIEALRLENQLEIKVIDTGIGIEQSQIENIFKEFSQANEGIEKRFGGTGLGLNISKRLINLLHGEIKVESILGEGSIFTLTLPLEEADIQTNSLTSPQQFKEHFTILTQDNILVVDDDKIQLQLMEELLSPIFKKIDILNDSSEIESVLAQEHYDLILSDIQMPKMDGFEMIHLLKNNPAYRDIPVVALSGKRDLTVEDFTEAGFTSAHQKPIQLQELLILITQLLHPTHKLELVSKESQTIPQANPEQLYDINQIKQFIGDDSAALRKFVVIFVDSTQENILDLHYAKDDFDYQTVSNIAHKMLPMFKQLQINHLVPSLEKLEDKAIDFQSKEELSLYIETLTQQIQLVVADLQEKYLD